MSAGQNVGPLDREARRLFQPPLPPDEATWALAAAAGISTVGLRPSFVIPAAAHSHPDCRAVLILIVAPQKDGDDGFREALEPVDDGDESVYAPGLRTSPSSRILTRKASKETRRPRGRSVQGESLAKRRLHRGINMVGSSDREFYAFCPPIALSAT